jgi:O-antigen ligase
VHIGIQNIHLYIIKDLEFLPSELGWGNTNCAATLFLLSIPACWYLITQVKNIIPFFVILILLYVGIALSNSDGALDISLIFTPIIAFFTYRKISIFQRSLYLKIILILLITLLVGATIIIGICGLEHLSTILKPPFSDSSRTALYQEALDLFAKYPIFGAGLGYQNPELPTLLGVRLYNFHSVLFHVMGTMGIIGIIAYTFYYTERFKILMKNYNAFTCFMLVAFILFECYGMVDTAEFNAIPLMSTLTVIIVIVELTNKGNDISPLPLCLKNIKYSEFV